MKLKVCGMRNAYNIQEISALPVDILGFIFYPKSKRYVGEEFAIDLPKHIQKAGVFVNEPIASVLKIQQKYSLDYLQIHGDESVDYCAELRSQTSAYIVKAFQIGEVFNFETLKAYQASVNYFLFDTQSSSYGGSGHKFNWDLLNDYNLKTPFFLSGGISVDDVESIKKLKHPLLFALDINSKFEIEPALKDVGKVREFVAGF